MASLVFAVKVEFSCLYFLESTDDVLPLFLAANILVSTEAIFGPMHHFWTAYERKAFFAPLIGNISYDEGFPLYLYRQHIVLVGFEYLVFLEHVVGHLTFRYGLHRILTILAIQGVESNKGWCYNISYNAGKRHLRGEASIEVGA